ncbi:MAG TPA: hypothetical protein PLV64_02565 [Anaerolineales bacterium]|nr:hypothetical protein [Anaerolineales bacterium]
MTTKSVLIQGGKEVFFDDSQVGAGALAQVLISADRKYVFKMEGAKGKDELQTLRELGMKLPPKSESRKLLLRVWGVEQHSFLQWKDAKVHVQECAPGKDLRSYAAKGALSFEDRLHIAIQTATLFKETNEAGAAYLDHKPREHVYWDADNRVIKVIDWNAALIKATEAERAEDFASYCLALADILDTNPHEENEAGVASYEYLSHPLNWSLETENALHHKDLGYRSWFLLALTSLTVIGKPFLQNWMELLQVFADVRDGKNSWLDKISLEHSYATDLGDASRLIGQLLISNIPTADQKEKAKRQSNDLIKNSRSNIIESNYQVILYRLLFAWLLAPSDFRTFCQYEVWRLFLANPDKAALRQLFIDLKPSLTWENYVNAIKKSSDKFPEITSLIKLKQKAEAQEKDEKVDKLISENKLSEAMGLLHEAKTIDPSNLDVQIKYNNIKGSDKVQSSSEETLRSAKSLLENMGDWEGARSKVNEVEEMWDVAEMPEHIKSQISSLKEQIDFMEKSKNEQSEVNRKLLVILNKNPVEQTSTQLSDFIENISSQIKTPEQREMWTELQKRYDETVIRERQLVKLNNVANFETWRNGLAEAAKDGNLHAKDNLINANLIGRILEKIQQDIKQIPNVGLEVSTRSYVAVQKEIFKLRESLKGEETSLRFLKEAEGELPALKNAILLQVEETICTLLTKQGREDADLVDAENILIAISSIFGEQEFKTREIADWLKRCRLIEDMKVDLSKWRQLSEEITKLPTRIFHGEYYVDLRQRIWNVLHAMQLIELTPHQWADNVQSLKREWKKEKRLAEIERGLLKKLEAAEQSDAAERGNIAALQQALKDLDDKLSDSEKTLKSEMASLQDGLKFLLSERQFQTALNTVSETLKSDQKEKNDILYKDIETLKKHIDANADKFKEIRSSYDNLVNLLSRLASQDQFYNLHSILDELGQSSKRMSAALQTLSEKMDRIYSDEEKMAGETIPLEKRVIYTEKGAVDLNMNAKLASQEIEDDKAMEEEHQTVESNYLQNAKSLWISIYKTLQRQKLLVSIVSILVLFVIAGTIFGDFIRPSALPDVSQSNPTETVTPTSTTTPTITPTLTSTLTPALTPALNPLGTPASTIILNLNAIQALSLTGDRPFVKLSSIQDLPVEIKILDRETSNNKKVQLVAALKLEFLAELSQVVPGQEYTIKPVDEKTPLKLYCLTPNNPTEPIECGEFTYSKDLPDTFKVAENSVLPTDYVWLEWVMWIPQSAFK